MEPPAPPAQFTLVIPHLKATVPVICWTDGMHYVPAAALCKALHLTTGDEIRFAWHTLGWQTGAELLPITLRSRTCLAWCLQYPLGLGNFASLIAHHVPDQTQRQLLERFIKECMRLQAQAWRLTQARFEHGRQRMHQLARATAALRAGAVRLTQSAAASADPTSTLPAGHPAGHPESITPTAPTAPTESAEAATPRNPDPPFRAVLRERTLALCDEVQGFVSAWLIKAGDLPVIDAFVLDSEGRVHDEQMPVTLFGVLTAEDAALLAQWEEQVAAAARAIALVVDGGNPN